MALWGQSLAHRNKTRPRPLYRPKNEKDPMKLSHVIWTSVAFGFRGTAALAQQNLTGTVTKIDEQKGTITIQQPQSGTVGGGGAA